MKLILEAVTPNCRAICIRIMVKIIELFTLIRAYSAENVCWYYCGYELHIIIIIIIIIICVLSCLVWLK